MGKGDTPRPIDWDKYGKNWDKIFGGDKKSTPGDSKNDGERGFDPPTSTISTNKNVKINATLA